MASTAKKHIEQIPHLEECDWATPKVVAGIERGVAEVDLIKQGKLKPMSSEDFMEILHKKHQN